MHRIRQRIDGRISEAKEDGELTLIRAEVSTLLKPSSQGLTLAHLAAHELERLKGLSPRLKPWAYSAQRPSPTKADTSLDDDADELIGTISCPCSPSALPDASIRKRSAHSPAREISNCSLPTNQLVTPVAPVAMPCPLGSPPSLSGTLSSRDSSWAAGPRGWGNPY